MELNLVPSPKSGLHTSVLKMWDRNLVLCASETDFVDMLHELHHKRHDEAHLKYLSHNVAVNEHTRRLKAANPHFAAGGVSQAARFPSLDDIGTGDSSIPSRGILNTMNDKMW
mmetsp:Transcript_29964/g.74319  ORF Transcript_29964/g.74319 Transcript_29964/m.74319 type:complete len:113 (-) Transcript_29964:919-1257(-)